MAGDLWDEGRLLTEWSEWADLAWAAEMPRRERKTMGKSRASTRR